MPTSAQAQCDPFSPSALTGEKKICSGLLTVIIGQRRSRRVEAPPSANWSGYVSFEPSSSFGGLAWPRRRLACQLRKAQAADPAPDQSAGVERPIQLLPAMLPAWSADGDHLRFSTIGISNSLQGRIGRMKCHDELCDGARRKNERRRRVV
ncbi:unnamed protein product [Phaeothamnion confervicola]